MTVRGQGRKLGAAALTAALLVSVPTTALAAGRHSHGAKARHSAKARHTASALAPVRVYDHRLLRETNHARSNYGQRRYRMNPVLWHIAHTYAEHLAKTGELIHNPALVNKVTAACPSWTAAGENIGEVTGNRPHPLFAAYMHSPPHRANLLDGSYSQVGIASVRVVEHGQTVQWNVIDFGNHCPR